MTAWYIKDCGWMTDTLFVRCVEQHRATPKYGAFCPETSDLNYQASLKLDAEMEASATDAPWQDRAKGEARRDKLRGIEKASPETVAMCVSRVADIVNDARAYRETMTAICRERGKKGAALGDERDVRPDALRRILGRDADQAHRIAKDGHLEEALQAALAGDDAKMADDPTFEMKSTTQDDSPLKTHPGTGVASTSAETATWEF